MADKLLGRLSGEELLQLLDQLDTNEEYFQESDDDNNEIALDSNVGCSIEVLTEEQHENTECIQGYNSEEVKDTQSELDNTINDQFFDPEIEDDSEDPLYDPDESVESVESSDVENDEPSVRQENCQKSIHTEQGRSNRNVIRCKPMSEICNGSVNNSNGSDLKHQSEPTAEQSAKTQTAPSEHQSEPTAEQSAKTQTAPSEGEERRGRKRVKNPETWARNVRRRKCSRGESYTNSRGKVIPERKIGDPCKCKRECFKNLPEECRNRVFKEFWDMGDNNKQNAYLFSMIEKYTVKRRRPVNSTTEGVRNMSYKYFVLGNDGLKIEVCLNSFKSLHGIGRKRVNRARNPPTVAPTDKRGKHSNRPNVIAEELIAQTRNHIASFPRRQSHYSRADNPNKFYLHENLNVRRMWLMYLSDFEPQELAKLRRREKINPKVKLWLYSKVFNTDFNLSFGMPRTDTCSKCDRLEISIQDAEKSNDQQRKSQLVTEKEMHLRKAQGAYDKLKYFSKKASESDDIDAYTFDFQQNLPVPCVTTSDLFYMRQLWTYNFGVHDLKTGDGIMHIWDESTAQRGSSEVCSCLENTILNRHSQASHLVLFSDGCCGQNKNKAMITFLASLCANPDMPYKRVDHYYLIRGHTYLPNDRDFALIEKRKRTELPKVPKDYIQIIRGSRIVQPFEVVEVAGQTVKDYKVLGDKSVKQSLTSNDGEKVLIRSVMWFSYGCSEEIDPVTGTETLVEHNNEVWCRYTHNNLESWNKVKLFKRGVKPEKLQATQKYHDRISIKAAKYKDLNNLVHRGLLSQEVADFYKTLPRESVPNQDDNDPEYEDDYVD